MIYLSDFSFPNAEREFDFFRSVQRTCYDSYYPFQILSAHALERLDFAPITILYGGNGCGKTTALNVIAEKLRLLRDAPFNRSNFLGDYLQLCNFHCENEVPAESRIITSDDVFRYMLDVRAYNENIDKKREELFDEYLHEKYTPFRMRSLADAERLRRVNQARSKTQSKYVRANLAENVRERSNGENAFLYFTEKITENRLYLLDEPENSLSPIKQLELQKFIEESARYFGCQFVISTHSPFLLAMRGAKIYDLDEEVADVKKWTELANVQAYFRFFQEHAKDFLP